MSEQRYFPLFDRRKFGQRGVGGYSMPSLMVRYGFPRMSVPAGTKVPVIGIPELGGGYQMSNFQADFSSWSLPLPSVSSVGVGGGRNSPGNDADGEVELDGHISAAAFSWITGIPASVVYIFGTQAQGSMAACTQELVSLKASVGSWSWGAPEDPGESSMDQALQACAAAGISVFAASGDGDSRDGTRRVTTDYPASSPYITGCGGTNLGNSSEIVWNTKPGEGTGGGFSRIYARPPWQVGLPSQYPPQRMVPDVAGDADPATGYSITADGQLQVVGGTSCVAPFWAGIVAAANCLRAVAGKGPLGFLNPLLYAHPEWFTDIVKGNNGRYRAGPGPDPCTGLGSPNGAKLLAGLLAA